MPTSELPDPHLAGSLFRLGKRNEAPKGSGGEHTLGVGPVTPGQCMACSFIQLPGMSVPVAEVTAQLSFLLSADEPFSLKLHFPRAAEPLRCGSSELRCTISIRRTGFLKM